MMNNFRLKDGRHSQLEDGLMVRYKPGDVVPSERPLDVIFLNKFDRLTGRAPAPVAEEPLGPADEGAEGADAANSPTEGADEGGEGGGETPPAIDADGEPPPDAPKKGVVRRVIQRAMEGAGTGGGSSRRRASRPRR
jgi:hypothetical protein